MTGGTLVDNKVVGFNYNKMDTRHRASVQKHAEAISDLMERTAKNMAEIGRRFTEVKKTVQHGLFIGWLYAEFRLSPNTAQRYMRIAKHFGHLDCLDKIQPMALDFLARKTTSPPAVEEAVTSARSGEMVSHKWAMQIVHKHSPKPYAPKPESGRNVRLALSYDVARRLSAFVNRQTPVMSDDELKAFADELEGQASRIRNLDPKSEPENQATKSTGRAATTA